MRLIVIYTAQNFVDQMLKDLKADVASVYGDGPITDEERLLIKSDRLRIVILNKEVTKEPPEEARIVPFDKLPDCIISEYIELVKGAIPGATLHSIAAIREKTHQLLSILNSDLDGAYWMHRALLREPSDSVDFAMNLITSEIETAGQTDAQARKFVDQDGLKAWLKDYAGTTDMLPYGNSSLSVGTIRKCIITGLLSYKDERKTLKREYAFNWVKAQSGMNRTLKTDDGKTVKLAEAEALISEDKWNRINGCQPPNEMRFVEVLYGSSNDAKTGCEELSRLHCTARDTATRQYINDREGPTIRLGSVIKLRKNKFDEWYLCLTPLCDCIRLEKDTKVEFLFLRLYPGKKKRADIYIETQKGKFEPLLFKAKKKKFELLTIPFNPREKDRIHTYKWQKQWRAKSDKDDSYQWVAELRYPKALAISHRVATNTSRVGVDEFEWLRRQTA